MKRVVNGMTYNTDTATMLARVDWGDDDDDGSQIDTLYQTRGGAFFLITEGQKPVWNQRASEDQMRGFTECKPLSPQDAEAWFLDDRNGVAIDILHNPFGEFPEATAETERGATMLVRLPT